ncbi:tail completion protein gp17 [Fibrella forsythiae]|uniref:DUF3168 domain-containing protein n=1 Tax=Fibrella forsythiae TaxID=2817061 RepID=A0ABS3JC09_9BACT|nr:DUF3168 domain-containing protein [Fibrella forsythiae]MBO0947523.1 DUF3168 domain-containing protein [Fibrella forsythiae]
MIDPGPALQAAYIALLTGFKVDGVSIPVYDSLAPDKAAAPYIILTRSDTRSDSTKTSFGHKLTVTLDVVTRFAPGPVSSLPAERIVAALLTLLFPAPRVCPLTVAGFVLWLYSFQGTKPLTTRTPTDTLIRRLVTINHQLHPA